MQPSWCGDTGLSPTAGGDVLVRDAESTLKERKEEAGSRAHISRTPDQYLEHLWRNPGALAAQTS